jgi:hypothetical protein
MIEVAVLARLLADTVIDDIVDGRGYQLKLPQSPSYPAIRVQLISEVEAYVLTAALTNFFKARVQVDSWASDASASDPYAAARALGQAVNDSLAGASFTQDDVEVSSIQLIDRVVDYEAEELRLIRVRQDYAVVFRVIAVSP